MERTLAEHICKLQGKVKALRQALKNDALSVHERLKIQIDLHIAERALDLYRKAYDLERELPD
ncbi:hypothetical protein [Occallatibacter savannae]|uniref:hypothetical protein n=1 Tax=Occallatibacter savannae TaxID=1002691 RepID=UPI000D68B59D|nr:hypothetical protein [Occallatibacter savannae]